MLTIVLVWIVLSVPLAMFIGRCLHASGGE
jgi:hypothetical protein